MSVPKHRPPLALRAFVGLIGIGATLATAALMLSDRAPGVLRSVFGRFADRIEARLDAGSRDRLTDLASDPRLPASDAIVHIGLWATVTVLAGLTVWSLPGLVVVAVVVVVASVVVETLQGRLTTARSVEPGDVVANAAGVAIGVAACLVVYGLWSGASTASTAFRAPATRSARPSRSPGRR